MVRAWLATVLLLQGLVMAMGGPVAMVGLAPGLSAAERDLLRALAITCFGGSLDGSGSPSDQPRPACDICTLCCAGCGARPMGAAVTLAVSTWLTAVGAVVDRADVPIRPIFDQRAPTRGPPASS